MDPLQPGDPDRVGAYRLVARIGSGGMGVVFLARSPGGRAVAVKLVRERFAADFQFRARFRREVAAARTVTGVSTAVVLDADPEAAQPWLATAYLPGLTLREAVRLVGALPATTLRVLAAAMAEALVDIHRVGLVHRDLKPSNVMVTADGVRVIDFGIARPEDATAITRVGTVVGTPGFMSPEQVSGAEVGPPSDVFSFGSVLMFAATGTEPFRADAVPATLQRVRTVDTDLDAVTDPWLRDLVADCLRADPAQRPTAAALLARFDDDEPAAGAGWLPPVLAEEVDRRAPAVAGPQWTADPAPPTGAAVEPPAVGGAGSAPRRRVLVAGAAALTAVAAGWAFTRGRDRRHPAGTPTTRPSTRPSPTVGTSAPPPRAVERWRVKVSDFYPSDVYAVGGVVVTRTPENDLFALDAATGRTLWTLPATGVGAVAGGRVFQALNINPELALLDPATGAVRWKYRIQFPDSTTNPAVNGSVVCFGYNRLRALNVDSGRSIWSSTVAPEWRPPVAAADVFVAAGETTLTGIDAATGRTRWELPVTGSLHLASGADLVFLVDSRRALHAVRATDGALVWQKTRFVGASEPRVLGTTLYASGGRGAVFAIDPATGDTIWGHALDRSSDLAVSGNTVCAATPDQTLHGLRATDGRPLWTFTANALQQPIGRCAIAGIDDRFFVGVREGYVVAFEAPDGGRGAGP